jgi:secreted trypsin-like serine protease
MRRKIIAATVAGFALAAGTIGTADATVTPRIVGGSTAESVSWGAQIYWTNAGSSNGFECSGSIIASQWVVTAQHCLNSPGMYVLVGSNALGSGTKATVDTQYASPNGDIALLHLATSISTGYITLGDADPSVDDQNSIYGWGRTANGAPASSVLKTATVQVTGYGTDAFNGTSITSQGVSGSAYHGDSGGPEIASGVQVGVCSTGSNDGSQTNGTQDYASIASSRQWITDTSGV